MPAPGIVRHIGEEDATLLGKTSPDLKSSHESHDSPEITSIVHTTRYIDAASALASIIALLVLLTDKKALLFEYTTWYQFLPTTRNAEVGASMSALKDTMQDSCDIKSLNITQFYVHNPDPKFTESYLGFPMAFETMSIYPSLLLIWVLSYSAAFQTYRASRAGAETSRELWPELGLAFTHACTWARVLLLDMPHIKQTTRAVFLFMLSASIIGGWYQARTRYRPNGPDFARWVEYALTSPLQIIIVAGSVWIRDRSTLYALGVAQANMIMNGYILEGLLEKMYRFNIWSVYRKDNPASCPGFCKETAKTKHNERRNQAMFVLTFAWVAFVGIWFTIISQFNRQMSMAGKCDQCEVQPAGTCTSFDYCELVGSTCQGRNEIPDVVPYIIGTQCLFFALFGVVQSWQLMQARGVLTSEQAHMAWHTSTLWYSILSVVAKCTLEIGFLIMLRQMPTTT